MARSAKQFFFHARFDPNDSRLEDGEYARKILNVVSRSPRSTSPESERIIFPGYANLWEFSEDHAQLCKSHLGGAWQSYVQRGHWRMVMPYTRAGQYREARKLVKSIQNNRVSVVHVFTFPALTINHSVLAYAVEKTPEGWRFASYDPNAPGEILPLEFNVARREFSMPPTPYFLGGKIDAYEVYCGFFL